MIRHSQYKLNTQTIRAELQTGGYFLSQGLRKPQAKADARLFLGPFGPVITAEYFFCLRDTVSANLIDHRKHKLITLLMTNSFDR